MNLTNTETYCLVFRTNLRTKADVKRITDYLKVNPKAAKLLISDWLNSENEHTQWIIKYATRKLN